MSNSRELTKEVVLEMFNTRGMNMKVAENFVNELTAKGYLAPEPEEPKKLTALEACRVIADGGKIKDRVGGIYPNQKGSIMIYKGLEPYTKIEETIEIDTEVWVNVYEEREPEIVTDEFEASAMADSNRIACEKFHLHRVIKKGE